MPSGKKDEPVSWEELEVLITVFSQRVGTDWCEVSILTIGLVAVR